MLKKFIAIITALTIISICFTSCSNSNASNSKTDLVDKTVSINSFNPDEFENVIELTSNPDFKKIYNNIEELYPDSENIIYGTVNQVSYFDGSGVGNTVYDFVVEKVYKGNLKENTLISVLTAGGYARLSKHIEVFGDGKFSDYTAEQINNTLLKTEFMKAPTPKSGDKYLLFLSAPTNNEHPFPDGLYSEIGAFMGRYVKTNNNFSKYIPEDEVNFYKTKEEPLSLKQIESKLEKSKTLQAK